MLGEEVSTMDKKSSRQSSVPPKNGATSDGKKNDNNSPNKFAKYGKKRESGCGRVGTADHARRPTPQKSRVTEDKRPRSRGYYNDRQREEVAERADPEYGSPLFTGGSKKANLNHLLNFTFAGRETQYHGSAAPHRGGRRHRGSSGVYNKERFLQANCQFVVCDRGEYSIHAIDPDMLVGWELVEQVRTTIYENPVCPICLQEPQAGKMTRCGHIYCSACILHYLALTDKSWSKCPICYDSIYKKDLKSVDIRIIHAYQPGETITLRLMKRERGSTYSVPKSQWERRDGRPHRIDDPVNIEFVKLLLASPSQIQEAVIEPERAALLKHSQTAEAYEVCFIESAMVMLKEREDSLRLKALNTKPRPMTLDVGHKKSESTQVAETAIKKSASAVSIRSAVSIGNEIDEEVDEDVDEPRSEMPDEPTMSQSRSVTPPTPTPPTPTVPAGPRSLPQACPTSPRADTYPDHTPTTTSAVLESIPGHGECPPSPESPPPGDPERSSGVLEIQQCMDGALPVEEAAEHLEMPSEAELGNNGRRRQNVTKSSFYYFQACDGQHMYLHAVNASCLVKEYGNLEECPDIITAVIIDTEAIFMTEELRKRLRYLNHLPLTCEFKVVELALKPPLVSRETLRVFAGDIEKRRRLRQHKLREEKKRSRKIEDEENEKMGKFTGMKLNLGSSAQFPAPMSSYSTPSSAMLSIRPESPLSMSSIASSPPSSPLGLSVAAADFVPGASAVGSLRSGDVSDGEQTMSFAQMLKGGKMQAGPPSWPRPSEASSPVAVAAHAADSEDSENEDRVPVPEYQASFSFAIQAALDNRVKNIDVPSANSGKKKKQKQKFTKLFTTSMSRGK